MSDFEARLTALGIILPEPPVSVANIVPTVRTGNLLFVSGQVCFGADGRIPTEFKGKLGVDVNDVHGAAAARNCALNLLAQVRKAVGTLDAIERCVRLGGFLNVSPTFGPLASVMNGASDLVVSVFGEHGRHARTTVGVAQLPLDACVEVDGIFELR